MVVIFAIPTSNQILNGVFIMVASLFLRSLQSVLFTTPYAIERKLEFSSEFIKRTKKIFTSDPTISTAPKNAPPQMPRIEIKSPDQSHVAQFSNNRITFHYQDTQNRRIPLNNVFPTFSDNLGRQIQCIMEFLNPRVVRLGFIVRMITDLGYSANRFLSEECLKDNPFPDAHEINLGILYKTNMRDFSINRWIRYRTLRAQNDPSIDYAMAIEIDLNTLAEEMNNYPASSILEFYQAAQEHISENLGHFPLLGMDFQPGSET